MNNVRFTRRLTRSGSVALACLIGLSACAPTPDGTDTAAVRPVKTIELESPASTRQLTLPGVARAEMETDLAFRVGGPLVALNVDTGQHVKAGETVAAIDPRDYEVRIATMEAHLASSRAALEEAMLQYRRYENLLREGAVARSAFDQAEAGYEMARAKVEADTRNLEDASNALADVVLTAPFDGFVDREFVENHETVSAGQPVISMTDLSALEVEIGLPADLLAEVPSMTGFACRFAAVPDRSFPAHLKEVGKQPNPSRQTYPLTISLDSEAAEIVRPGMAAEVTILLKTAAGLRFVLPVEALITDNDARPFVWVVNVPDQHAERRTLHAVELSPAGAVVTGDLQPGDRVIIAGGHHLIDRQPVRILEPASATNIGGEL